MGQNNMRSNWTFVEVDNRLKQIIQDIFVHSIVAANKAHVNSDHFSVSNIALRI